MGKADAWQAFFGIPADPTGGEFLGSSHTPVHDKLGPPQFALKNIPPNTIKLRNKVRHNDEIP